MASSEVGQRLPQTYRLPDGTTLVTHLSTSRWLHLAYFQKERKCSHTGWIACIIGISRNIGSIGVISNNFPSANALISKMLWLSLWYHTCYDFVSTKKPRPCVDWRNALHLQKRRTLAIRLGGRAWDVRQEQRWDTYILFSRDMKTFRSNVPVRGCGNLKKLACFSFNWHDTTSNTSGWSSKWSEEATIHLPATYHLEGFQLKSLTCSAFEKERSYYCMPSGVPTLLTGWSRISTRCCNLFIPFLSININITHLQSRSNIWQISYILIHHCSQLRGFGWRPFSAPLE